METGVLYWHQFDLNGNGAFTKHQKTHQDHMMYADRAVNETEMVWPQVDLF